MGMIMAERLRLSALLVVTALAVSGCATGSTGTLKVTVEQVGGPMMPNGKTPSEPAAKAEVQVSGPGTDLSSVTGDSGVVSFQLPGGSYSVSVPTCGSTGKEHVTVTPARSTSLTWICPVP
jgi:hypothetical protein